MKYTLVLMGIFSLAAGVFNHDAAAQVSISPAPSASDQFVTVIAPAGAAGGTIDLYSRTSQAACTAADTKLQLQQDTGSLVQPGGTTEIAVPLGTLIGGTYVCAAVTAPPGAAVPGTTFSPLAQVAPAGPVPVAGVLIQSPLSGKSTHLQVASPGFVAKDTFNILTSSTAEACAKLTTNVGTADIPFTVPQTMVTITPGTLKAGNYVCITVKDATGKTATTQAQLVGWGCKHNGGYTDCSDEYSLVGGIEQSGLSAQNSITNGFYDLFVRRPVESKWASIWFRSRFLGSPSTSSTGNVLAAATDPSGTVTTANLPQSVIAIDYAVGLELGRDLRWGKPSGSLTIAPIVGFGATTPLDANTAVSGFEVPPLGTNECTELQARFTAQSGYKPALPGPGYYTDSSMAVVQGCVVEPAANQTAATSTNPGTQITAIAFSNEDRSNFLLKWGAGLRVVGRYTPTCQTPGGCQRLRADFSFGQDEAITGGYLRHWLFKADAVIPVPSTSFYFFASSVNRLAQNLTLSPLILTPVTVNAGGSTACTSPPSSTTSTTPSICVPSTSVFVLPYKQPDRDYYRIGIGIDAVKLLSKLFSPPAS